MEKILKIRKDLFLIKIGDKFHFSIRYDFNPFSITFAFYLFKFDFGFNIKMWIIIWHYNGRAFYLQKKIG